MKLRTAPSPEWLIMAGNQLSPRLRELIRQGAWIALNPTPEWLDELDRATVASNPVIAGDPTLIAAVTSSNRTNLIHFATAHLRDPGAPVAAYLGPEPLRMARLLVRRGLGTSALDVYRITQNVALQRWTDIVFELTEDPLELHDLLNVFSRSASEYVDATLAGIARQLKLEHSELAQGVVVECRKIVEAILRGDSINHKRAEARLGYGLSGSHTAAIIWYDEYDDDYRLLDRAAEAFSTAVGCVRPLTVKSSEATQWVWLKDVGEIDTDQVRQALEETPKARIAIGANARGLEGFRRSHKQALAAQHMMVRLQSRQQIGLFDEIQMVALLTQKPDFADEFINSTLGAFASAGSVLRDTLLTYINEQCNAARAAQQLYIHRNTLLGRLDAAQRLLPRPLEGNTVRIAVALEALTWRGNKDSDLGGEERNETPP
jgi:DNA-binding PucR family transcriptional regulator